MEVKQDPRIVLDANDINQIWRNIGGKSISLDDGRVVSFEIAMRHAQDSDENFANEMVKRLLSDANTEVVTNAIVNAIRSSESDWTNNEVEMLVGVLNEKFGTGTDRADFILGEEFSTEEPQIEGFEYQRDGPDEPWSEEDVKEFMEEFEDGLEEEAFEREDIEESKEDEEGNGIIEDAIEEAEKEQKEEQEEESMLDNFDPSDSIKQEAALVIEENIGLSEDLALTIADELRSRGLLAEE